jgi:titin
MTTPQVPARRARLSAALTAVASLAVAVALLLPAAAAAWTTNSVQLDNGTCGRNLQGGSDKTASSSSTPTFYLQGDGGLSTYSAAIDGVPISGTFNSAGNGNVCIATTVPLADGPHTFTATEIRPNPANAVPPFSFSVDTTPPAAPSTPVISAYSDSGVVGDGITKYRNVNFTGTADPNISVQIYDGGLFLIGGAKASATGTWSATSTTLADGVHTISAYALDSAGNISLPSMSVTLTIDGTAPTVPAAPTLDPGSDTPPVGDNTTTITTPVVTGTVDTDTSTVTVYSDGNQVGTATPNSSHVWHFTLPTLAAGTHSITVSAGDVAGNTSSISPALSLTIGTATTTAPGAPTLNQASGGNGSVTLVWNPPSSNGGATISSYSLYRGTSAGGETLLTTVGGSTTTYVDSGVTNGTTYFYKVSATNSVGEGARSNESSATPAASVPGAPSLTSATAGNGSVALSWSAPSSNGGSAITAYKIYRGTTSGGEIVLTTVGTVTSWTDSTAANGTTYFYVVSAVNGVGEGTASNERSATPATVPGAPSLSSATAGSGQVTLVWSAPGSNGGSAITAYKVYRGTASGGETLLATVGTGTTYLDTAVTNNTTYWYQVSAVNTFGEGARSGEASATPVPAATIPGAPTLTSATAGNGQVTLAWNAPASNGGATITAYKVYRGTASGGETLLTTLGAVTGWTDTGTTNGTTYWYTVSAVNSVGEGVASNERSAAPATTPGAPTLTSATAGNGQVAVAWSAPASNGGSSVTAYKVYRATSTGGETLLTTLGAVTGWTDTSTANGTAYYYKVSAVNAVGESALSNERTATPSTVPGAASLTSATAGNAQVSLAWTAPASNGGSTVTGYKVYRSTTSGSETLLMSLGNVTSWTDTTAANGTTYWYQVTAVNANGESARSSEVSATPATVPGAPSLSSATAGSGQVTLVWSAPGSNGGSSVTAYKVYRGTSTGGETLLATVGTGTTYLDTAVTNNTTYWYQVSAVNTVGEGARSGEASATPVPAATIPGAPTLSSATAGNGQVTLAWNAPASNGGATITNYKVYRGTASGGETLLTTLGAVTGWTDTGTTNGTTYWYTVSAVNSVGEGVASNERSAAPATVPGAPTLASATAGNGQVALTWTAPPSTGGAGITAYKVYRATTSGGETLLTTLGAVTSYTDSTTANGTAYYYEVSAVNAVGEGALSNERSATPSTVPGSPSLTSAGAGNGQVSLAWSAPGSNGGSTITGYKVYRGTTSGSETLLTTLGNVTGWTDAGAANGTTYYYEVAAVNAAGQGAVSNERSATPATVPGAPTLTSATAGNGQVSLAWSAPGSTGGSPITGYRVYRGASSGSETSFMTLGNVTTWTDSSAANGTTYYYEVTAINAPGESAASNERSATPSAPATVPSSPTLSSAVGGNGSVSLSWAAPASNGGSAVTGYDVYRGTASGVETLLVTLGTGTSYTDSTAANGTTYWYQVSAVNAVGEGSRSNERSATPVAVPGAPTLTSVTGGAGSVMLSWSAPGATGGSPVTAYRIYRSTAAGAETLLTTVGTVTSFNDSNVAGGTTYYYEVSAVNTAGEGQLSNERSASPITAPGAPVLSSATAGSSNVVLSWSAPSSTGGAPITGYRIYRGTSTGAEAYLTMVGTVASFNDTTVATGTTYYYQVSAVNTAGEGQRSNEQSATTVLVTAPGTPSLTAATAGNGSVSLVWNAPASDGGSAITSYRVYRGTASGAETLLVSTGTGTTFTDSTAVNGTTYWYEVSAVNALGESLPSNERSASPATLPGAPTLSSATAADGSVALVWSAPASNGGSAVTGYDVYRGTAAGSETLLTNLGPVTSFTDTTALDGTTYWYVVSAVNTVGEGVRSGELSATPAGVPGAPVLGAPVAANGTVSLSWTAPASSGGAPVTGYRVYRGTTSGAETLLTTLGTVTTWTDTSVVNGATYWYEVAAVNSTGTGLPSTERSVTLASVASAPTLVSATPGNASVVLVWTAPVSNGGSPVTGYKLYRGTASGAETLLTTLGVVTTYTDTPVVNGTTYWYKLTAVTAAGEGLASTELSAKPATVPGAPTLTSATGGSTGVTLVWTAPTSTGGSAVTGYKVYRATASGAETLLTTVGLVTTYTDTTVATGTTYYFQVSAVNLPGEGLKSAELSATKPTDSTAPSKPGTPKALVVGTTQIALDWTDSTDNVGVAGYQVYRDGSLVATVPTSYYLDSGLAVGSSHTYYVKAVDAAGNASQASTSLNTHAASLGTGSTGTLSGVVFGPTGAVLANAVASVTVNGKATTAKTNTAGVWKLSNLAPGTYAISISLSGYQTQTVTMTVAAKATTVAITALSQ